MGYGIYLTGTPLAAEQTGAGRDDQNLLSAIRDAIEAEITDPLQRRLATLDVSDNRLQLELHPSAEPIEISVKDCVVEISAKTSGAGPGYHAMLAELIKNVALRATIVLPWDDLQVGWAEDTGYLGHRDLELLRAETIRLLKTISRHILEAGEEYRCHQVNLPIGDCPTSDAFVFAPMGEFSRDWFQSLRDGEDKDAAVIAERFLAAWHGPDRAEYWAKIGKYLILWDLDWTVPINEAERALYETLLGCYDRARQLDPSIAIPDDEIREARELLEGGDPTVPPRPDGQGYRRRMMERRLHYGWSAQIPGYFRRERDVDGDKVNNYFWFGDREIHFKILGFDSVEGGTTARDYVLQNSKPKDEESVFAFTLRRNWLTGRAVVRKSNDHCTVQAMYGVTSKGEHIILVLTLVHEDTPGGRDWAKTLLESISYPTPEPN